MTTLYTVTPQLARRLALVKQRLAGARPPATAEGILEVVRDLGGLQLDPTNAVARSHLLVLWSRLGPYDPAALGTLLWQERRLFEHSAYVAPTGHYAYHAYQMRHFPAGDSAWPQRVRQWLADNEAFQAYILSELERRGPLTSGDFEDRAVTPWKSSGWTGGRNLNQMLEFLSHQGKVIVAGRQGGQRLWDLPGRWLPAWTPRQEWSERETLRWIVEQSIQRYGVAQVDDFNGRRAGRREALAELEAERRFIRVVIEEGNNSWPGQWYVHAGDVPLLERLAAGEWEPRTTLLSPFDNLIYNRERSERLFNFHYRLEIYVPKAKRQYGYYVLPILHGDRLIGRIDPVMDRRAGRLTINAVYAEADAPMRAETGRAIGEAIASLAAFLKAREIAYSNEIPAGWRTGPLSLTYPEQS